MENEQDYYERYWADPNAAPPATDPTTPQRKALLQKALAGLPTGAPVLDMGCGTGEFTQFMAGLGYRASGIDLSPSAIAAARQKHPGLDFHVGTMEERTGEWAGQFAAIWSSEVIEHVFDVWGFLSAAHAALAPAGRLILTTPYHGLIKNLLIDLGGYANHYKPMGGHVRFFDRRGLDTCLTHCGFTARHWTGYGRPWPLYKSFFVVAEKTHAVKERPPADS